MNKKRLKGISMFITATLLFSNLALANGMQNVNAAEVSQLVISQYVETNDGTTPKGIELLNVSDSVIDFSATKLSVLVGVNGKLPLEVISVSSGALASGELIVVGTTGIKEYLITQGLGSVLYADCGFNFNGDDSIQIKLGSEIVDTFGEPGKDPGTNWSGNEVSTANFNIQLKSDIITGAPLTGWTDPSIRFETVGNGSDLTGFGVTTFKPVDLTDSEAVLASKVNLSEVSILNGNASLSSVTKNLLLPTTGINSTNISWSSTNTLAVSNSGTITRPIKGTGNAVVELTATITKGIVSDTSKFSVTVLEEELSDADSVIAAKANLSEATILNGNASLSSVTKNLLFPTTGINSTNISWNSTNTLTVSNNAVVTRPSKGSGNSVVELTATITKGIVSDSKKFSVTVLEDTGNVYSDYYASASGKTGEDLKATLNDIIDNHKILSYAAAYDALEETDRDPNNSNNVLLLYTGRSINGPAQYNGGSGWNREHVWAKSHGNFGTTNGAGTDIHHLRPTDVSVNSDRGHLDFDNGGTPHPEATECKYDADSFEPRDEVKGDVARMIFYMAVRYEGEHGELDLELADRVSTYPDPLHGKLSVLLEWNAIDPVSNFEMTRNNVIYEKYQNNRNPFIDHPEWAASIWGSSPTITDEMAVASAKAAVALGDTSAVTNDITLPASSINEVSISWISSNSTVISNTGIVVRPKNGTGNATVTLTATIRKGTATETKEFIVIVKENPIASGFNLKISNVLITNIGGTPLTNVKQGGTAVVNANVINNSDKIIKGMVIIKLTGSDNKVIAIGFLNNTEIKTGAPNEYGIGFTLNNAPLGVCKASIYVWDGLTTINPLSDPLEIEFLIN